MSNPLSGIHVCRACLRTVLRESLDTCLIDEVLKEHCALDREVPAIEQRGSSRNAFYTCCTCSSTWWVVQDYDVGDRGTYLNAGHESPHRAEQQFLLRAVHHATRPNYPNDFGAPDDRRHLMAWVKELGLDERGKEPKAT